VDSLSEGNENHRKRRSVSIIVIKRCHFKNEKREKGKRGGWEGGGFYEGLIFVFFVFVIVVIGVSSGVFVVIVVSIHTCVFVVIIFLVVVILNLGSFYVSVVSVLLSLSTFPFNSTQMPSLDCK